MDTAPKSVELKLVEIDPVAGDEAVSVEPSPRPGNMPAPDRGKPPASDSGKPTDPFFEQAKREYEGGRTDLPLWASALAKHQGDEKAAVEGYLKARAIALKLERREQAGDTTKPRLRAPGPTPHPLSIESDEDNYDAAMPPIRRAPDYRRHALIAIPLAVVLAGGVWWFVLRDTGPARALPAAATNAATPGQKPSPPRPAPSVPKAEEDFNATFAAKVQEYKDAGNWNLVVLYASEWTRKKPDNGAAWKELSNGFAIMRQFRDALEAGTKAAQLVPNDPLIWRNLGQVNVDLNDLEAALKAFERAVAIDELDVQSMIRIGEINTQLNRFAPAQAAFQRALTLLPNDAEAQCGMAQLAQRQARSKEGEAGARLLRGTERNCRDAAAGTPTSATASATAPSAAPAAPSAKRK